jgi:hypothetical protein
MSVRNIVDPTTGKILEQLLPPVAIAPSATVVGTQSGTLVYNPGGVPGDPSIELGFVAPYTGMYALNVQVSVGNANPATLFDANGIIEWYCYVNDGSATELPYSQGTLRGSELAIPANYLLLTPPTDYSFTQTVFCQANTAYLFNVYAFRGQSQDGVWNLPCSVRASYIN